MILSCLLELRLSDFLGGGIYVERLYSTTLSNKNAQQLQF